MDEEVYVIGSTSSEVPAEESDIPETVSCTACNKGLKIVKRKIFSHPRLNVLLCKSCVKFLSTNEFTKDEQGIEEYCTWCGDGGNLVCCDFCEKAYCKHCVKRNLGKDFLKTLLSAPDDSKWKCFYCDNGQIITFVDECKAIMEHIKLMPSSSESTNRPPNTKTKEPVPVKSTNLQSTNPILQSTKVKSTNHDLKSNKSDVTVKDVTVKKTKTATSNGMSALSNSQLERRRRLKEVTKQVENVSSERVGFKSSFPRYEISDDDDDTGTPGDTPSVVSPVKVENGPNESDSRLSSMIPARNSSMEKNKPQNALQVPVIDKAIEKVSTTSASNSNDLSGNGNSKLMQKLMQDDTTSKRKSLSSVLEKLRGDTREVSASSPQLLDDDNTTNSLKDVHSNDKELQKDGKKDTLKSTKKEEEKEANSKKRKSDAAKISSSEKNGKSSGKKSDEKNEEKSKSGENSKKKKQTIVMLSSSEGSDEEIIVMSKSGKRRVISKSLLRLAQAAMESKESKKSKKDDKPLKKEKKNSKKKKLSDHSSSADEKSSDDSDSDNEPLSKVVSKNSSKVPKTSPVTEDKLKDSGVDEQQPGPSGVRPKNKLQRSKLGRSRPVVTSESSDDDSSVQRCGILSKKFRHKEENAGSKGLAEEADKNETQGGKQIPGSYDIDLKINKVDNIEKQDVDNETMEIDTSASSHKQTTDVNDVDELIDNGLNIDTSNKKVESESQEIKKCNNDLLLITGIVEEGSELESKQVTDGNKDIEPSNVEECDDIISQVINDLCDEVDNSDNTNKCNGHNSGTDSSESNSDEKENAPEDSGIGIPEATSNSIADTADYVVDTNSDCIIKEANVDMSCEKSNASLKSGIQINSGENLKDTVVILDTPEKGNSEKQSTKETVTEFSDTGKSNSDVTSNEKYDKTSKADIEIDSSDSERENEADESFVQKNTESEKNKKDSTEINNTDSEDETLTKKKTKAKENDKKKATEIDSSDSEDETLTKEAKAKENDKKVTEIDSTDSEDETLTKEKTKEKESDKKKATEVDSSDSEDETLTKKKTKEKENDKKKATEINSSDSEDETLTKKKTNSKENNKKKETETDSTDSEDETLTKKKTKAKENDKKKGTEINSSDSEDETLIKKKTKENDKKKDTEIDSTGSEDETLTKKKTKAKENDKKKATEINSSDSEDETLTKKKTKENDKKKETETDSTDSEEETLTKKKTKENDKKKATEINSSDSEDESLTKKKTKAKGNNKKKATEINNTDSDDESPLERRVSKRKKKKVVEAKEGKGSDSESSVEARSHRSKRKKIDKDDDDYDGSPERKESKRKHKSTSENSNSDSDSDVPKKTVSKSKKKKRMRLNSNANESSSSNDDDDDDVVLNNLESDSSSTDGSIIITRKSKRIKGAENSKKKKVKKIKKKKGKKEKKDDSNTDDEDEDDNEETPSKGRKKIRRILKDTELDKETIKAQEAEEERRKRLLERTQAERAEVNIAINVVDGDFILEKNENKEPLVALSSEINQHLKPHQRKGIQFMYDCLIETVASYKKGDPGGGCLLAHCMGLGKTLQVVSLVHTFMNNSNIKMEKFLVVCPLNTVLNWETEFEKWIPEEPEEEKPYIYVLSYCTGVKDRVGMLKDWFNKGGVIITGYEMYRNLVQGSHLKSKKMKLDVKKFLSDPGPDMVVCDEGHILKNDQTAISKAMSAIRTQRRVVLTGTPLQNNLLEYHCMVDFVKPKLLGTRKEYQNRFVNPILNGQCSNSTSLDVRCMKQRCHVLFQLLAGCVQRQDYSVLTPFLPQKREYTIFVRLGEKQIKMYEHYLEEFVYRDSTTNKVRSSLFSDFQTLARIWSHPWCLHIDRVKAAYRDRNKYHSEDEFLDDEEEAEKTSSESDDDKKKPWNADTSSDEDAKEDKRRQRRRKADSSDSSNDSSGNDEKEPEPIKATRSARNTRATRSAAKENGPKSDEKDNEDSKSDDDILTVLPNEEAGDERGSLRSGINFKDGSLNPEREGEQEDDYETAWFDKFLEKEDERNVELGGKLVMLLEILANAEAVGDKILVFSQSLTTLDLIEKALTTGSFEGDQLSWLHGVDYFRMDGSTPVSRRKRWADIFNDPENEQCRLFLISTRAGSLGINMVGANRVIVFDCSWNPSHDVQSVFRVYRFGQEKPVYVYRLIAQGTMEEKIYGRQITKLATAGRVVDEQQIGRHFTDEEIRELYTFSPDKIEDGIETPQLPKDPLLAEVLQRLHPKFIVRYHEHDLLLENVEAEELSEEERKLAWKNYEDEKEGAAKRLDFRNFVPPPVQQRFDLQQHQQQQQFRNFQQYSDLNHFRVVGQVPPGFQRQRYTISYPPEMTMEQRQQALLELRQREVMRLLIQQRNQQTASNSTIISNNHGSEFRHVRLQNIAPRPAVSSLSSGYRIMPGANNISSRPINNAPVNNATANNPSSVINTTTTQKTSESHQGGYLAAKKSRPSQIDIT